MHHQDQTAPHEHSDQGLHYDTLTDIFVSFQNSERIDFKNYLQKAQ